MNESPHHPKNGHLARRVIERIEGEHVKVRPRWEFILKNYVFWGLGALTVALGACAASVALFDLSDINWPLSYAMRETSLSWFLAVTPFLWIIAFALFLLVGYVNIRWTNHGYRYPLSVLALGVILTSLTLGTALYAMGLGEGFETTVRPHLPRQFFFDRGGLYRHHHFPYAY